ncbi:MAG: formylglycine-generating enzyme family protein [Sandaracinaceae bacterium]
MSAPHLNAGSPRVMLPWVLPVLLFACGQTSEPSEAPAEPAVDPAIHGEVSGDEPPQDDELPEDEPPEDDADEGGSDSQAASANPCGVVPEGMTCIPGGRFSRGRDDGPEEERGAADVTVSSFLLDTHEVTNVHYRECIAARVCRRQMPYRGYMGDAQPAVGMRWEDADAYCRWREKRLPTEAEFERAIAGPDDLTYPWGEDAREPCSRAIVRIAEGRGCGTGVTWDVGSRPVGPWGLYDISGNVWEWVSDHWSWCYRGCDRECGDACEGTDPRGACGDPSAPCPEALGRRVVRGGAWWHGIERATSTARRGMPALNESNHRFGFRCARDATD